MKSTQTQKSPMVSIVIPTYKRSDTLEQALKSAYTQTYKNVEVIVVDDNAENPNDRIKNKKVLANYPDVVIVENSSNLGGGLSRNEGVKKAKGDFIAFLDDDDQFMPEKIERQLNVYQEASANRKVGVVYCYAEVVRVDKSTYTWERNVTGYPLESHIANCIAPSTALLIPKNAFNEVGGFEDISSRQDATLIMKLIMSGYSIELAPALLYKYFWHDGTNGITKTSKKSLDAELQYRKLFIQYAEKANYEAKNINYIHSIFSARLVPIMLKLGMNKEAFLEVGRSIKTQPFSSLNFFTLAKIIIKPLYLKLSEVRERRVRLKVR